MATKGAVTANADKKQPAAEPPGAGWRSLLDAEAPWIALAARLLLGAMWLYYSVPKLTSPTENIADVRNFQILPSGLVSTFGSAQPCFDL